MSTPELSRCEAVEWRMECGLTLFIASEGMKSLALAAVRSTSA